MTVKMQDAASKFFSPKAVDSGQIMLKWNIIGIGKKG
jgi:hypothetical protein